MPLARKAMVGLPRAIERSDAPAEQLGQAGLALAPRAQHPAADDGGGPRPAAQVGQDGTRRRSAAARGERRARRRATLSPIGQMSPGAVPGWGSWIAVRPGRHLGLAQVVRRHPPAPAVEHGRDPFGDLVVELQLDTHDPGDHVAGDVVLGRAQPAAHDDRVGAVQRRCAGPASMRSWLSPTVVGEVMVDAGQGQLLTDPRRSWCRRSGRAAARSRRRRSHIACRRPPHARVRGVR